MTITVTTRHESGNHVTEKSATVEGLEFRPLESNGEQIQETIARMVCGLITPSGEKDGRRFIATAQ